MTQSLLKVGDFYQDKISNDMQLCLIDFFTCELIVPETCVSLPLLYIWSYGSVYSCPISTNITVKTMMWIKAHVYTCTRPNRTFFFLCQKKKCPNNIKEIYNDKYRHTRDRLFSLHMYMTDIRHLEHLKCGNTD